MTTPHVFGDDVVDNVDDILADHINNLRAWLSYKRTFGLNYPIATFNGNWIEVPDESWSYNAANKITVPAGAAGIYKSGDQVRLKQGGSYKYYSIITVADTLLTVTGGSDYTVADATITDAAICKIGGVGHPVTFNWSPDFSDNTTLTYTSRTIVSAKFLIIRKTIQYWLNVKGTTGGSTSAYLNFRLPIGVIGLGTGGAGYAIDGGAPMSAFCNLITANVGRIGVAKYDRAAWNLGENREIAVSGCIELS